MIVVPALTRSKGLQPGSKWALKWAQHEFF